MTSRKKILVLGSTGMLGHHIVNYLKGFSDFIVDDISYRNKLSESTEIVDATSKSVFEEAIVRLKPDFIINCIGILVKGSQDEERAVYLNAYLPHQLKKIACGNARPDIIKSCFCSFP